MSGRAEYAILEPARRLQVIGEPDVLVVGGGPAGIAAACAAARAGATTTLIERWGFLGGTLTAVTLGGFCGVWAVGPDTLRPVVGGLFTELIERLKHLDGVLSPRRWGKIAALPYDPTRVKIVADAMTEDAGVDVLFHTFAVDALVEEGRITAVVIENKGGRSAIVPKIVIDCTGDGDVAARAGAPYKLGDGGITQFGSSMFRVANVDMERFEGLTREDVAARLEQVVSEGTWLPRTAVALYPNPIENVVHFNATRVAKPDGSPFNLIDPRELSAAEREGRRQALLYENIARTCLPGFERARIIDIGPQIGIRETRLIEGDAVLTAEDVMSCSKPADGIACNAWPVEIHTEGLRTVWKFLPDTDYYKIPYGCLLPRGITNLLVAGRNISATHEAQASVRVSAPCFALGEAAGTAAVLALDANCDTRAVSISTLQARLRSSGAILDP